MIIPSLMVLSGGVRLSKFRVSDPDRGLKGYTGLPVTLIAGFVSFWIILLIPSDSLALAIPAQVFLLCSVVLAAFLQVSNVHYPAPTKKPAYMIFGLILLIIFGILWLAECPYTWIFGIILIMIGYVYGVVLPVVRWVVAK